MSRLKQLEACGQSVWLDYLTRELIAGGGLNAHVADDGVSGVTSNPSIFEKAIVESADYQPAIRAYLARGDHSVSAIYEQLAIADIKAAADVLRPVFDRSDGRDGYISLECSPYLANDTEATIFEALRLWRAVARPNLMIKVPATAAGIPAIRELTANGVSVNITLLFSVAVYEQVVEAYLSGLEACLAAGRDLRRVASVASFFISRIDSAVDARLARLADRGQAEALQGKVGIANAKLAYQRYLQLFAGPRWQALANAGARSQRLLWASTSTKNPAYPPTLYIDALIGRDTVNTIPPKTMQAFAAGGTVVADAVEQDIAGARAVLAGLGQAGISLAEVTAALTREGVGKFADAFDKLFGAIAHQRRELLAGGRLRQQFHPGTDALQQAVADELDCWRMEGRVRRLWARDARLWRDDGEERWLGWLDVIDEELADASRLGAFADDVQRAGFRDVVLLGQGGSSLGAEVLGTALPPAAQAPRFHVMDSTDPDQLAALEQGLELARTLFIVSSKSGSTLEPNIFLSYFHQRMVAEVGADKAGSHFVAVTDPGSPLEARARAMGVWRLFYGTPEIGGRYSVLSKFGLVPAAAALRDVGDLLQRAQAMARSCGADVPPDANPGVVLGVAMGVAATRFGRDKVTVFASPPIAGIGGWLEQLLAESTGKEGRGLIPVEGEPLQPAASYGADRFFVYVELAGHHDPHQRTLAAELVELGHPVVRIRMHERADIGQEFFRWEMATAVAGAVIGINPFNQPDVEGAKIKARELTEGYEATGKLPAETPIWVGDGIELFADARNARELGRQQSLAAYLRAHFARVHAGDYVAILAYVARNADNLGQLTALRQQLLAQTGAATCLGFGPRFQHSTGQIYKGGPDSGVFLQITSDNVAQMPVPGHGYGFHVVKMAQAHGDLAELSARGRRLLRVHLHDVARGLAALVAAVSA